MEMKFDISKMVEEIAMQAEENQEEFIFQTIRPYCENILQIKINKEELKQILLNGIQKQQPCETIHGSTYGGVSWGGTYTFEEQQPCEDCISRAEALHACCDEWNKDYKAIMKSIRQLPSVTPQQTRWIPVSERLPKDEQKVLVTTRSGKLIDVDTSIYYHASAYWEHYVIAWMPLPEPYKAESEDKE